MFLFQRTHLLLHVGKIERKRAAPRLAESAFRAICDPATPHQISAPLANGKTVQVVVGAAIAGAGYAALSYFNKDKDVADSLDQFGSNVRSDARGKHGAMA